MNDEKKPSSRRRTRPPTRKHHLLDGQRAFRREKAIFSTTVRQGEKMNPSGVQFGKSRGLLQIRGDEVLLSEKLLETISLEAQQHVQLGRRPIQGNFLVDFTVRAAQDALATQHQGTREENLHLFTDLNRVMYYTLCRVVERAGVGHKERERFITDP